MMGAYGLGRLACGLAFGLTLLLASESSPSRSIITSEQGQTLPPPEPPTVDVAAISKQSLLFLAIEHTFRLATEAGTREELRGPFLKDWWISVKSLGGWGDGDGILENYIGHPMQGAVSGFIYLQNHAVGRNLEFEWSRRYWSTRLNAMLYAAVYSLQFELGPISEASIGNVGKKPGTMGFVDLVITPVMGTGVLVGEDLMDYYVIKKVERRVQNPVLRLLVRSFLNPCRAFANMMRFEVPWHRDTRPGVLVPAVPALPPQPGVATFSPGGRP